MLSILQTREMILASARAIVKAEPYLTEIDSLIGDSDHGANMKLGFSQMISVLENSDNFRTINELMKEAGMSLLKTMGGASGVIFGTIFIGGLTSLPLAYVMDENFFAAFLEGSLKSLQKRSKAVLGDKTVMDAFIPAVEAACSCGQKAGNLSDMIKAAADASEAGMERTKAMMPKIGRSRAFGEKAIGIPDAGAVSVSIMLRAFDEWMKSVFPS
ncbi:MAG: dihydroxyacetone kinase subunit L [Synergistaceae bacterium]|jgi:dihydroxyacetone kinase-like protein|nr:dihydroxyacetone kinase subunit L [Synergistaceae bacterium]